MTTKKRTISPRITDETRDLLTRYYGTANAGAQVALEGWPTLRDLTLQELDDIFEEHEWIFIDRIYPAGSFDLPSAMNKTELLIRVKTAIELEPETYPLMIIDKIKELNAAQLYYLVEWACMPERLK